MNLQIAPSIDALAEEPFVPDPAHRFIPTPFQKLAADRARTRRPMKSPPKITHLIGALGNGGAERQLINLVTALADRQMDVNVLTLEEIAGPHAFHLPALSARNIPARAIDRTADPIDTLRHIPNLDNLLAALPAWLRPWPFQVAQTLAADPPDILHLWLDFTNITGAIAALMLGIPRIMLSTRSVNPTHFSYMNTPWFRPWYAFLATVPDLLLLNNSLAGRDDYARWMNVSPARFEVIYNGVSHQKSAATADEIAAFRRQIGVAPQDRLLAGIFRFSEEKRPLLFLETACRAMHDFPTLHTAIIGHGPLEADLRAQIAQSPFASRIHLVGPRTDMPVIYAAADVLLQTSTLEGTPNTLLEAQCAGCPVVSTPAGGAVECLLDGQTGFIADDAPSLAARVCQILGYADLRKRISAAGRIFIRDRFAMQRMVDAHVRLYGRPQRPVRRPPRSPMPQSPA